MKKNVVLASAIIIAISFVIHSADEQKAKEETKTDMAPVATQQALVKLVDTLIKANSAFLVKLSHHLLPRKVQSWQQKGLVKFPTKQVPWITFKKDVNEFNTFLHALLTKNPQTGTYYHLESLQKNRPLYEALQKIQQALATYEPKIEQTTPVKLGKESLEAMQQLINVYGTLFYQNKLLDVIKKFLQSFETEAKKIRTQEETAAQRAGGRGSKVEIPLFEEGTGYDLDLGSEFDFTAPITDSDFEGGSELDIFSSEMPDDFISSFFD